jgi:hypothetical protein
MQLTEYQQAQLNNLVKNRCQQTAEGKWEFLGIVRPTVEELQGRICSSFRQDSGEIRRTLLDMVPENSSLNSNDHPMEIGLVGETGFLDNNQEALLSQIVRAESYRDGAGNYRVLGRAYASLEDAVGGVRAACIATQEYPLSLLANYKQNGVVPETHTSIEKRPTFVHLTPVQDDSTMVYRIYWRTRHYLRTLVSQIWKTLKEA